MPFVLCDLHGGHPAPLVCPHLVDEVRNHRHVTLLGQVEYLAARPPSTVIRLDVEYGGEIAWSVHLCADCGAQHGFTESTVLPDEEGLEQVMGFDQQPVCGVCFDELRGSVPFDSAGS